MVEKSKGLRVEPSDFYKDASDQMKLAFCRVMEHPCEGGSIVEYRWPSDPTLSDKTTAKSIRELLEEVDEESELAKVGIAMFNAGAEWIEIIREGDE